MIRFLAPALLLALFGQPAAAKSEHPYATKVRLAIERSLAYPAAAKGAEGTSAYYIRVDRNGKLLAYHMYGGIYSASLANAFDAAVAAAKIPPVPQDLEAPLTLQGAIRFDAGRAVVSLGL